MEKYQIDLCVTGLKGRDRNQKLHIEKIDVIDRDKLDRCELTSKGMLRLIHYKRVTFAKICVYECEISTGIDGIVTTTLPAKFSWTIRE